MLEYVDPTQNLRSHFALCAEYCTFPWHPQVVCVGRQILLGIVDKHHLWGEVFSASLTVLV
jgi:hypothetical protein